jgi:hypothetical protein
MEMVPHYKARHELQEVGVEGLDLTEWWHQEILISARAISRNSIQQFDNTQFHIASRSRPGNYHAIDLDQVTCECQDFPRIHFCKHIAAVHAHFPHLCAALQTQNVSKGLHVSRDPQDISTQQHIDKLTKDITELSKIWATLQQPGPSEPSLATIEVLRSAKYSFEVVIASIQGLSALPNKLPLAPNRNTWTEMAEQMGVKQAQKQKGRHTELEEHKFNAHSIGVVKGGHHCVHNDPYSGCQQSSKHVKSDAISPEANACARAATQSASIPTSVPASFPSTAHMAPPHFM